MDFQRAAQVYLWSLPAMGLKGWENANIDAGASPDLDGQFVIYQGYDGVAGIMTPNQTVKYIIAFVDTAKFGPAVWEVPPGLTAGYVGDQWQRPVLDCGVAGPEKGKGTKLLIVGPGQKVPKHDPSEFKVVHSPTNVVWLGTRNMETDPVKIKEVNEGFDAYPFNRPNLKNRPMLEKSGKAFIQAQPHGMAFWENMNAIIQREVMEERDVFFWAMLKNLGIEKGKPFEPNEKEKAMLIEAERFGYLMAVNNTFKKRFDGSNYYGDRNWFVALVNDPMQKQENHGELDERASWFHEAIGSTYAMKLDGPGPGSTYLGSYEDTEGRGYDGGKTYKLNVPAKVPAGQFWSVSIYNSKNRTLIKNDQKRAEINSINGLVQNDDGSTDVFIGPKAPKGMENNWVKTQAGQTWFTYFRLYNPEQAFFDKSWKLNDIVEVE